MKNDLITLLTSSVVFVAMLWARRAMIDEHAAYTRYYVAAGLMISGILSLIIVLRLCWHLFKRPPSADPISRERPEHPRAHYRLTFDRSESRPRFVQAADGRQPAGAFTCPVLDISETGIALDCTGVYTPGQTVHGEIIFASFRTAVVNGTVVREETDRTSLQLHCTIAPPLLMAEQREQIVNKKGAARPAVSKSLLENPSNSLPSHRPKGICRIK